jgi:NAD(P)-dependent dehydrogenase (short-subunit alcohol dehydrogenase family)
VQEEGAKGTFVKADLSSSDDVQKVVEGSLSTFGRINVLFNNAGIFEFGTVVDCSEETWDRMMAVNLKSMFLTCKYAIPKMLEVGGGSIVNVASVGALVGVENATAYAASKGGVVQLTKSIALDFGKRNVRANCICPGSIETPMLHQVWSHEKGEMPMEAVREAYKHGRPLGRIGRPLDIANAAVYLASDESQFVTGTCLTVDGGIVAM